MKYIKLFSLLLSAMVLLTALSGCDPTVHESGGNSPRPGGSSNSNQVPATAPDDGEELFVMEPVGYDGYFKYFRDTMTDVLYTKYECGQAGGLTAMLDPESGLPLTYARYMELAGQPLTEDP